MEPDFFLFFFFLVSLEQSWDWKSILYVPSIHNILWLLSFHIFPPLSPWIWAGLSCFDQYNVVTATMRQFWMLVARDHAGSVAAILGINPGYLPDDEGTISCPRPWLCWPADSHLHEGGAVRLTSSWLWHMYKLTWDQRKIHPAESSPNCWPTNSWPKEKSLFTRFWGDLLSSSRKLIRPRKGRELRVGDQLLMCDGGTSRKNKPKCTRNDQMEWWGRGRI